MMTFSEKNRLAFDMGAVYELGYWRFPSAAIKESFERRVMGLEWTPEQQKVAIEALRKERQKLFKDDGLGDMLAERVAESMMAKE